MKPTRQYTRNRMDRRKRMKDAAGLAIITIVIAAYAILIALQFTA